MSSLLRHPAIVPSLFSDGLESDSGPEAGSSLPRRALALVMQSLSALHPGRFGDLRQRGSAAMLGMTLTLLFGSLLDHVASWSESGASG